MSLRLIKPGMSAALRHPKTGALLEPIYVTKAGKVVWPGLGASSDDPDDPAYTGKDDEDDEDEDDEEDDEEDEDVKKDKKTSKKGKDDDEEDDEDSRIHRASQQAKRYRLKLRAAEKELGDLTARMKAIEDQEKAPDEVASRDIADLRSKNDALIETNRVMHAQLAFFKTSVPGVTWIDASDVFALAERSGLFDDVIDEDGTIDETELRRSLKDLAKRKPHLVKKIEDDTKARGRKSSKDDVDEDEDDVEEPRSSKSASTLNGRRKGTKGTPDRAALSKKFPVLGQF